jgi:hypothetical protein
MDPVSLPLPILKKVASLALGCVLLVLLSGALAPSLFAQTVTNGSFEAVQIGPPFLDANPADIPGWTHTGSPGDALLWGIGYVDGGGSVTTAGAGNQFVTMGGGAGAVGSADWSTTITGLTPGASYVLSFMTSTETSTLAQTMTVSFSSGSSTAAQAFTPPLSSANYWMTWVTERYVFVATASSATVHFSVTNQAQDMGLDNVSVAPATATTYTSDTTLSDFTGQIGTYATLTNYSAYDTGAAPPYTPTAATVASGLRIYNGTLPTANTILNPTNNWLLATFPAAVSTIVVFPNIDHYGAAYDGYQYQIYGSNDGQNWTLLFDALTVNGEGEPFTLGTFNGTAPTTVNNVLTPGAGPGGTVGYIAFFTFGTTYKFFAFGASTEGINSGNADSELSAVGTQGVVQTFNTNGTTAADFSAGGFENKMTFDTSTANGHLSCNGQTGMTCPSNLQLQTTNTLLSNPSPVILFAATSAPSSSDPSAFPPYVVGTPFATALCAGRPANGPGDACSLLVNECFGGLISQANASDFYCPFVNTEPSAGNFIGMTDTWDPMTPKPDPSTAPGTTFSLISFVPSSPSETWTAAPAAQTTPNAVCTNPDGTNASNAPGQCDFSDSLVEVYGDQTTTRGTSPKSKAWLISVYNVYMPLSYVSVNGTSVNTPPSYNPRASAALWFKSPLSLSFLVDPACPLNTYPCALTAAQQATDNYFVPAPVASETFDVTNLAGTVLVGPTPATPPTPFYTQSAVPITFTGTQILADGEYFLQWGAKDNVGIVERSIKLVSPDINGNCAIPADAGGGTIPAAPGGKCYSTNPFEAQLNVDSTPPTITTPVLSTTTPLPGQMVTATYSCADPLVNGVRSGIATCGTHSSLAGVASTGPLTSTFTAAGHGAQNYQLTPGAIDVAGNSTAAPAVPYYVGYQFFGFFAPVSNPGPGAPVINTITSGQTVPVQWRVLNGNGVGVTGLKLGLSGGGTAAGTVEITASNPGPGFCKQDNHDNNISVNYAGSSGLQDMGGGNYTYAWRTSMPSGTCVMLTVNPGDGTLHSAYFYAQ